MATSQTTVEEKVSQFMKEYADDRYCLLELLRFFGRHPHTRFSRLVIVHALNSQRFSTEKALKYLLDNEVVQLSLENNVPLYSLATEESLRNLALHVAKLDWYHWHVVIEQVYPLCRGMKLATS